MTTPHNILEAEAGTEDSVPASAHSHKKQWCVIARNDRREWRSKLWAI